MPAFVPVAAGAPIYAANINALGPKTFRKTSGTTRASTTTLADDPDLVVPVEANGVYFIEFIVRAAGILAADIKTAWTVPSGTSGNRHALGPGSTASDAGADNISGRFGIHGFATSITYSGVRDSAANQFSIYEYALVNVGATAGNIVLQWAQATSNATGSVVAASSFARSLQIA